MALRWSVCLLFLSLPASSARDASLPLGTPQDGSVNQDSSDVLDLTVPVTDMEQRPAVRLTVMTNTSNLSPLLVSVQQNLGVSSFELPRTHNGYHFQYYSQIMCPFLNRPSNNSNGNVTITMTITVSTLASNNVSYTIFAEEVKNFYLQLGDELNVVVNPGGPAVYYYQFPTNDPRQQVLFHLTDNSPSRSVCALVHIQDSLVRATPEINVSACPLEIGSGTLNLQGEYQTMLGQGGILQQQPTSGRVYIGITIVPDDFSTGHSICSTTLSADLLASFVTVEQRGDAEVAGRNITDQSFSRKNITLRVRPGRSVAEYAYSMAILAAVFLLFYLIALIVISRFSKELLLAFFSGRLCGNNVDAEKDEEDGVEMTKETDCVESLSTDLGTENKLTELGDEETDGGPKRKPPTINWAESIEMEERPPSFIPRNGVTQSLPRNHGGSANSTPERYRKTQTISRDTRIPRPPLRRQRTSYSESSSGGGGTKFKPSVLDILSGRYEDYRVRADSGSRRGTGSSTVSETWRHGSTSSTGHRRPFQRASTISSSARHDLGTAEQLGRPPMRKTSSLTSPTDDERPSTEREREGVPYVSNYGLPSQEPRATMSLPLYCRANTLASNPSVLDVLSGRYEDYRMRADSESRRGTGSSTVGEGGRHGSNNPTAPSPSEHPQTPSTVMPSTPLDSIKEEDTLTRKPRPPLSRIASVDESEVFVSSQSSESSRGSGSGTPVLTGRHSPASPSRRSHLGVNLQKTVSKEENELLTPLITTEPVSSGFGVVAAQASSTEPAASSIVTPNAVTVQIQPNPEVSEPMSYGVESPPSSAASPPANGQLEEREERSASAQPLTEQEESTAVELRSDDVKGDFLMDPTLAEMTFPEGKAAQQQSNRFLWQLIGVSFFYLLPAFQLVLAYQKFLDISGNQDLCFYNHLCSWPISILRSANNIWSNCGYVALGLLLFAVVYRAKYNYRRHERVINEQKEDNRGEKEGVPQYFGIYFALSFVLIAQGFTSAAYHVCPNQATFQFDTTFMYIMAGLAYLRIFQSRHPDRTPSASFAFILFALILSVAVLGTLHANVYFYIVWFFVYQLATVIIVLEYYYRWRLTSLRVVKIKIKKLCRRPVKPGNVPKFVFGILCLCLNLGIGIAGVWVMADFGSHMLVVFISNFAFYMIYYIIVKLTYREWPPVLMVVYFVIAFLFWIPAIYFFLQPVTDWSRTASQSREGNRDCILFFYDEHDLWHVLSAFALFFSMLAIMNFDSKQRHWRRDRLKVF